MTLLDELEARSIAIVREAYFRIAPLGMLWSMGKDSTALLWLVRKAFFGSVPFPVILLDTEMELPEVYAFRDELTRAWNLDLRNEMCPPESSIDPTLQPATRAAARKTAGLRELIAREKLRGVIVGIRRDEQSTRAKERVFSPRLPDGAWDVKHQPPELWDVYQTDVADGQHVRIHPLLDWTEVDIWRYTLREAIPIVPLYLARDGKRYRSLGEKNITVPIDSHASSIEEIITELETTRQPERAGRVMDHESEDAFERLRTGRLHVSQLRVVAVGHVDHGKSTLIGRLLHETGNLPDGKVAELLAMSERRGVGFEWSFVLDALQSERDQAVTIDTTRIWMRTPQREIVLIDAPGHKEFLRNMVTGASDADAALLLVDAYEGVSEQTRRHALLLELIGVPRAVVAINKMDRVGYDASRFEAIRAETQRVLERAGVAATAFVPISAREGENVVLRGAPSMPFYDGPSVLEALVALPGRARASGTALRLAVQGVVRRDLERIIVGRIESGALAQGDEIVISPSRRTARVASLTVWPPREKTHAGAGESIGFTLDGPFFVDRGDVISDPAHVPAVASSFRARLLWLGARPMREGDTYGLRFGTRTAKVDVTVLERVIDIESLDGNGHRAAYANDVADVVFASPVALPLDAVADHPGLARFILLDGLDIVAGGTILEALGTGGSRDLVPVRHLLDAGSRARRNGHLGAVVWLTGLPASGKSTIAMEVERRLFEGGCNAYVLDGDNVRAGLNSDLGFKPEDRHENIRRVGELAALFADSGTIAIASFISPYRTDRAAARRAAGAAFHEIYIKADPATCEARDPKGHYKKARAGELPDFTGITGDYEEPHDAELVVDTTLLTLDAAVDTVLAYLDEHVLAPVRPGGRLLGSTPPEADSP